MIDKETYEACLNIAKGCHDYNGGHHQKELNEAFHHGISTVITCLEKLKEKGLDNLQLRIVHDIGSNLDKNETEN